MESIRTVSLVTILHALGFTPIWMAGCRAGFDLGDGVGHITVDLAHNRWYSQSGNLGGRGDDLVALLKGMTKDLAGTWIADTFLDGMLADIPIDLPPQNEEKEKVYAKVTHVGPITSSNLRRRINREMIPLEVADRCCQEIAFCNPAKGTSGYGFGLQNEAGGYGIINWCGKPRNVGRPEIALIRYGKEEHRRCLIFVGLMDYLSFVADNGNPETDVIVLFSSSFARSLMRYSEVYDKVDAYLPNTPAKGEILPVLKATFSGYHDLSTMYASWDNYHSWYLDRARKS